MKSNHALPEDLRCIGPAELATLIGRSQKSIQIDVSRRPATLPPRFVIPGTRKVLWRIKDVRIWMEEISAAEKAKRERAASLEQRFRFSSGRN